MVVTKKPYCPPPTKKFLPIFLITLTLLLFALKWRDIVIRKPDGAFELAPKRIDEGEKEKEKLESCETYRLSARANGWYLCYLCDNGTISLKKNEVWKYGYSCNPEMRYKEEWLQQMNLQYIPILYGDIKQCRLKEIELILGYPLSAENLQRPESQRLVVPPGHRSIKLR